MDQVRKILGWLKQQHFWVLSGLVAVIAIFCWWSASRTLFSEFQANKQAIDTEFTSLASLRNKAFHPNDVIIERQKEEATKQANHVRETWQKLYDRQRENVLEWPDDLSPEFLKHIETLKFGDEIPRDLRNNYQNYARRYFPELPKIVGARELPEGQGAAGYGGEMLGGRGAGGYGGYGGGEYGGNLLGAGGEPLEDDGNYICQWLDQGVVREALRFPQRPASIRIWVTQEDLWVYKALLTAIRRTNEAAGATRMSNAAIRIIYQLQVGKTAAPFSRQKDRIYMVPSAAPVGDPMLGGESGGMVEGGARGIGSDPYGAGTTGYGGYGGETTRGIGIEGGYGTTGGGAMTEEQEKAFLTAGRYLDEQGKPIGGPAPATADGMMDPMAPEPAADPTSFGTEYKRLPVRMVLQMDQRWLTRLISECANQPLQIEVREVRINPQGVSGEGGGGMLGGGYSGGYGGRGGGGGMAGSMFPELTGIQTFPAQPNIVDVEIQGIIYIFNEPNPTVLQVSDEPAVTASL